MKKTIVALFAITAFAGTAFGADMIEMKKNVKFNHKAHSDALKECTSCHKDAAGGKIEGFGKELAHGKACKGCHVDTKKGPTGCSDCHKK
jgi:Class III cytochrome C family